MKIKSLRMILVLFVATLVALPAASAQAATDPPHDISSGTGCLSCHQMSSTYPKLLPPLNHTPVPGDIDDTVANGLCWSCHNDPVPLECSACHPSSPAPYVKTHSSLLTSNDKGYGNWAVECWVCHNPHLQEQDRYNGSTYGMYIRRSVNLAKITGLTKTGSKSVKFIGNTGENSFADGDPAAIDGICEVCHTRTSHFRNDGLGSDQSHANVGGANGSNCTAVCHKHTDGFIHGAGGTGCDTCHGHDENFEYSPGLFSTGAGSSQSHSTHTEHDDELIGPPVLTCDYCHNTADFPSFKIGSGTDIDGDGKISLTETNVCDQCHSEGGPYDGLNDAEVGAKKNWRNGIYTGGQLAPGKEKWCVTCHDSGTSTIGSGTRTQAPDVARDNTGYGYYISGHGAMEDGDLGRIVECADCHDLTLAHIDGNKTYKASSNNYQAGYRLAIIDWSIWGPKPLNIPNPNGTGLGCDFNFGDYQLCFRCHDARQILDDTRADGVYECDTNPYNNPDHLGQPVTAITTGFRNMRAEGMNGGAGDWPANIHWDHLVDINSIFTGNYWDSDRDGTNDSKAGCITCHNPHGATLSGGSPTKRMTRQNMQIEWGTDPTYGDYGTIGASANLGAVCFSACHGPGVRYYRAAPAPALSGIQATDSNGTDPAPAEAGFTNNRTVRITFTVSGTPPTEMRLAEDATFTQNATAWLPYAATYDYTLSNGDGSKSIYARLKTGSDLSDLKNTTIILDTTAPSVSEATLTTPNGGQTWLQDTAQNITWSGIGDANLKSAPITLRYSTDSGATYPGSIAAGESNNGSYAWTVPAVESTQAKVQLTAADKAGNQAADASDADFTIAAVTPLLSGFTVTDRNSADPAPAEAGYTNNQSVTVTLSASNNPTFMQISEDPTFTAVPWIPFAATSSFTLSGSEGSKTVYCKVKNGAGESGVQSATIIFDHTAPDIPLLTAPDGGEFWTRDTDWSVTWDTGSITDALPGALKASPINLAYSTDSGTTYANTIVAATGNSGSYLWHTPVPVFYGAKVQLTVTDRAGNQSSDASGNIMYISPPADYIVTNTADDGPGSLRRAISDLLTAGGNETIWFDIPNANLAYGVADISITSATLPPLSQPGIIIDGGSQAAIHGDTNPNGPEVRLKGTYSWYGLDVTAADVTVRDLQFTQWWAGLRTSAARTALTGNHLGFASDTTGFDGVTQRNYGHIEINAGASNARIGAPGQGNYLSCSWISTPLSDGGTGSVIDSNVFGLLPNGAECGNSGTNGIVSLNTSAATVRSNVICGSGSGIYIFSSGNTIQGNTFGVWYDGTSWHDCTDPYEAIRIQSGGNNLFGGPNVAVNDAQLNDSNVIDPGTYGIHFINGNNDRIFGNFIGTNPEKDETFPGTYGIHLSSQWSIAIGGGGTGKSANVVAHLTDYGVYLSNAAGKYITISRNSFYDNGTEAISLIAGANEGIQPPVIAAANAFSVTVNGVASGDTVEVFRSDGVGTYGQGKTFINSAVATGPSVTVDISGAALNNGDWVTATRTNSNGSTSAFSLNIQLPWP